MGERRLGDARGRETVRRPSVVAHRGSSARHPDNTWAAFEAAVADGADAIECDVLATADGELVLRHDLDLAGTSVAELDLVRLLDSEPATVRLPELLAWAAGTDIALLVEIKDPAVAGPVARLVARAECAARTVIGGFHAPALARAKAAAPGLRTSLMIGSVLLPDDLIALARAYGADGVHPCWESRAPRPHQLLDAAQIAALHAAGLAVTLWHEEREDELQALVELGADAICTNEPARLRRIIDARFGAPVGNHVEPVTSEPATRPEGERP